MTNIRYDIGVDEFRQAVESRRPTRPDIIAFLVAEGLVRDRRAGQHAIFAFVGMIATGIMWVWFDSGHPSYPPSQAQIDAAFRAPAAAGI
ncbi:hypothetical protein [Methylocystis sp.]|uniref:hypothetical protein n=1 Tax=Methylocystis sp. TaxID=1911079 RepID=UPI003DA313C8